MTAQKKLVYDIVRESAEHPSAEMIYRVAKEREPTIAMGTVYRNLQQMAQEGRLRALDGPVARCDAVLPPHTHIRCVRCGQVKDFALPYDAALDRTAAGSGWAITGHDLVFSGLCPVCGAEEA